MVDHGVGGAWLPGAVVWCGDGARVEVTARPAQGTRHEVLFGRDVLSGGDVVVKLERIEGTLETERRALTWLTAHGGLVPHLRSVSWVRGADGGSRLCLVSDRAPGEAPQSDRAWERLGAALARLSALPWRGSGLMTYDQGEFMANHQSRVRDLGSILGEVPIGLVGCERVMSAAGPLVLTHGDPGPGNFLDDRGRGTLIDWEEAQVAPRGLDLARAMFIALLGVGPSGYQARDHARRSLSVAAGYLSCLGGSWAPEADELRSWLAVAAVQFAHRRMERAGQPGVLPHQDAIETLVAALRSAEWLPTSLPSHGSPSSQ
jgi:aminoglycoside phosphotransferase